MNRPCKKILLAGVFGVALAGCGSTGTGTITDDNGLIGQNSDAAGVNAGEAALLYGSSSASGTGTASGSSSSSAAPRNGSADTGDTRN